MKTKYFFNEHIRYTPFFNSATAHQQINTQKVIDQNNNDKIGELEQIIDDLSVTQTTLNSQLNDAKTNKQNDDDKIKRLKEELEIITSIKVSAPPCGNPPGRTRLP